MSSKRNFFKKLFPDKAPAVFTIVTIFYLTVCAVIYVALDNNEKNSYIKPVPVTSSDEDETGPALLINVNTASKEELMTLEGIGETLADRIIEFRENYYDFHTIDDLLEVEGIGKAKLDKIRKYVTV